VIGSQKVAGRMPAVFIGHGNPMNAIERNSYTAAWTRLAESLPRPRAILSISAHWYVPRSRLTANERPRTIHDFGGFPRALYQIEYPAPGSPGLAERVSQLLRPAQVALDEKWGLDHGTWSVLLHMFPGADIPVIQLGIDETLSAEEHYALALRLRPLRDDGVLVFGSGNVVHNLHAYAWGRRSAEPYDWAVRFESKLRDLLSARDFDAVVAYESFGPDAALAAPTPDHFLPLLYVVAQAEPDERLAFPVDGFDGGSVSMLGALIG
jgi:4,5-DOPA dioxygenase extradiol